MRISFVLLMMAVMLAVQAKAQFRQLPPMLQMEVWKDPARFDPVKSREKNLLSSDYILLGIEVEKEKDWQGIVDMGGEVNTQLGARGTVWLPRGKVLALAAMPGLRAIHYNPLLEPHNDLAIEHVQADKVHAGLAPFPQGYSGKEVVMGVIDTGVDYLHEDFRDPDNPSHSRIAYIWDQWADSGEVPAGFSYGAEWTRAQIEEEIAARPAGPYIHLDTFPQGSGHGTHVSGTAAGNRGLAYEADLIVVATTFSEASIIDAANYILQKATEMEKPCVINLSLGSNTHAHDGTDFLSETLSQLVDGTEGAAIVASAGNDGHRMAHWGGFPLSDQPASVYYAGGTGVYAFFRMPKTDLSDFEINIAVDTTQYSNGSFTSIAELDQTPWLKLVGLNEQPYYQPFYYANDSLAVELFLFNISSEAKDYAEFLVILDEGWNRYNWTRHRDELELFRFHVRGSGQFHAWFSSLRLYAFSSPEEVGLTDPAYRPADTNLNLGSPCDGRNILCVGAYTNREKWVDLDGQQWSWPPNQETGDLANFSSTGPTIDGRIKPEIVAPGKVVASAVPAYNDYGIFLTGAAPREAVFSGTSMSAPVVSGAVALLLEADPQLTHEEIRNVITNTATQDRQTEAAGILPNGYWGYGKLNVYKAMLASLGVTAANGLPDESSLLSVFPNPARQTVHLLFQDGEINRGELRLRDLNGRTVLRTDGFTGGNSIQLDVSTLPRGMYMLEWTDGERRVLEKLVVN